MYVLSLKSMISCKKGRRVKKVFLRQTENALCILQKWRCGGTEEDHLNSARVIYQVKAVNRSAEELESHNSWLS